VPCNPSYSGGRDQGNHGSKRAGKNSLQDPISKVPIIKKKKRGAGEAGGVAQGEISELKSQYQKIKQTNNNNNNKKKKPCYFGLGGFQLLFDFSILKIY
jgi:hypothetical protein